MRKAPKGKQRVRFRFRFPKLCLAPLPSLDLIATTIDAGLRCLGCLKAFTLYGREYLDEHDLPLEIRRQYAQHNESLRGKGETRTSWLYWKKRLLYPEKEILPHFQECHGAQKTLDAMQKKLCSGMPLKCFEEARSKALEFQQLTSVSMSEVFEAQMGLYQ